MKRIVAIIFALVGWLSSVIASTLTPQEALERALGAWSRSGAYGLNHTYLDSSNEVAIYEFGSTDRTIYVAARDEGEALLGWTDGPLSPSDMLPPSMQAWLSQLADALPQSATRAENRAAIDPLLATTWNQSNPYNIYCPVISGQHAPVGCVATAMAMVIHHNRVFNGSGVVTINDNEGNPWTIDLADVDFDFEAMPLGPGSSGSWDQVALLSSICGVTTNMKYGLAGSGTYLTDATEALRKNMGYDPTTTIYLTRRSYTIEEWNYILYNELTHNRPIIYAGGTSEPHCFVCDGYQPGNYFHFNWGWGGLANGYFALTSLIPSVGGIGASSTNNYTGAQECVLCRVPGAEGAFLHLKVSGYCAKANGGDDRIKVMFNVVGPSGDYPVDAGYIVETSDGVKVKEGEIGEVTCRSSASASSGVTLSVGEVSSGLSEGYYLVYPAYRDENTGEMRKANEPKGDYALGLNVSGTGYVQLVEIAIEPHLWVEEVKLHGAVYKTTTPDVSFRVTNTGRKDAYTSMSIAILDPSTGERLRTRTIDNVELAAGGNAVFRSTVPNYKVGNGYLPAGEYVVAVCNSVDSVMAVGKDRLRVLDAQDPSVVSASAGPSISIERVDVEPELLKVPCQWAQTVYMTVSSAQSATIGVAFFTPGSYTPSYKYTIPYQRWEKCTRQPKEIAPGEINPSPGRYEVAYMAGGQEVSVRRTVDVPLCVDGLYYMLDAENRTASVVAASADVNGHVEVAGIVSYQGVDYKVIDVEAGAFANCPTLVSVGLPTEIVTVEGEAFVGSEPSSVVYRSAEVPFSLWQSVYGGLYEVPVNYVPHKSYDMYRNALGDNDVYSIIDAIDPVWENGSSEVVVKITPVSTTYQQALMAETDKPEVVGIELKEYRPGEAIFRLKPLSNGVCEVTFSHPQPGVESKTIAVSVGDEMLGMADVGMEGVCVGRQEDGRVTVSGAQVGQSVRVYDVYGRMVGQGATDAFGRAEIKVDAGREMLIVGVGVKFFKLFK